ncbi:hypothetical protein [Pseudomonas asiatica]|uniref:hypothetical protein n=1 Tax=Pseudomonas asiatica TaxID=2219225 RepID=UPI0037C6C6C7
MPQRDGKDQQEIKNGASDSSPSLEFTGDGRTDLTDQYNKYVVPSVSPITDAAISASRAIRLSSGIGQKAFYDLSRARRMVEGSFGSSVDRIFAITEKLRSPADAALRAITSLHSNSYISMVNQFFSSSLFAEMSRLSIGHSKLDNEALQAARLIVREVSGVESVAAFQASLAANSVGTSKLAEFAEMQSRLAGSLAGVTKLRDQHKYAEIARDFSRISNSPLFEVIERAGYARLVELVEDYNVSEEYVVNEESQAIHDARPEQEAAVQSEILEALESTSARKPLSPAAYKFVCWLIAMLISGYTLVSQWKDFQESVCELNDRVPDFESTADAQKKIRSVMCHMPSSVKSRTRLVAREGMGLRYSPSIKSDVIVPLKQFATLEVVDSFGRIWLEVIYRHEGVEIRGWVTRSMVKTIQ